MKKLLKVAGIVVGILILLIIGLSIFVQSYLSSDRLKPLILPRAEAMTGRKVYLDEVGVSLFKGIVAKGLSVKERDGQRDFVKVGRFVLSYRLLPLLKKQLVISKIEIGSPSISIKKERGGRYNFSDITESRSKGPQEPKKPSGPEPQGLPVSIVADRFSIQDANLTFVDEEKGLPDVSIALDAEFKGALEKDGTPRMDFGRISLKETKAKLKDVEVKASGKIDMDAKTIRANIQTMIGKDTIELSATAKDYRSAPDIVANLHAKTLDLQHLMALSGEKKVQEGRPQQQKKKEKNAKPSQGGMEQTLKASGQITVDKATYQDYTVKDFRLQYKYIKGDIGFQIQNANLTFVDEEKGLPDVSIALDAEFKGALEKDGTPRMDFGRISFREIKAKLKDLEVKGSGKMDMDAKTIRANMQTMIGKDTIELSATAKDYRSAPDIVANLHAKTLDLQHLMGLSGGKKGQEGRPPQQKQKEKKAKPSQGGMEQKLKASGQITVDKATYQDYTVKDLRLQYKYAKGEMRIDPLALQFSGEGSFTAEGALNGNLQCATKDSSAIQKTLRGTAAAKLGKGAIKQSLIFDAIALLTGIPSLKNPGFDEGLFNFDVKDGRVFLDGWIRSSLFKVSPKGVVDFEKRLDIPTELKFAPSLTGSLKGRLAALKLLEDEQGWKVIPLKIKGTTEKPSVNLDEEALLKQLGRGLTKELERRLFKPKQKESDKPSKKKKSKGILEELLDE